MSIGMSEIKAYVRNGGVVRYILATSSPVLVMPNGTTMRIDRRSYRAFYHGMANTMTRTEAGSADTHDLVITWSANGDQAE